MAAILGLLIAYVAVPIPEPGTQTLYIGTVIAASCAAVLLFDLLGLYSQRSFASSERYWDRRSIKSTARPPLSSNEQAPGLGGRTLTVSVADPAPDASRSRRRALNQFPILRTNARPNPTANPRRQRRGYPDRSPAVY